MSLYMCNKNISLIDVLSQLRHAVEQQDWESAGVLDRAIKKGIKEAVSNAGEGSDKSELIGMLKKIQGLYDQLIADSEQARLKLSDELKKVSRDNKAANFYLKSSHYR
tara:strand:+ start:43904 stop:44227 length:324 start_codon:yes stop_codon:yes gene_type:complete